MAVASNKHPRNQPHTAATTKRGFPAKWLWWAAVSVLLVVLLWPALRAQYYIRSGVEAAPSQVAWRTAYPTALEEAKAAEKPLLLVFSASWCPPCQLMKHEVWPDAEVGRLANAGYVPVLLDPLPNQDIAEQYGVEYIPAVLIVSGEERVLGQAGAMSVREARRFLAEHGAPTGAPISRLAS